MCPHERYMQICVNWKDNGNGKLLQILHLLLYLLQVGFKPATPGDPILVISRIGEGRSIFR